jgi:hypothetical protein
MHQGGNDMPAPQDSHYCLHLCKGGREQDVGEVAMQGKSPASGSVARRSNDNAIVNLNMAASRKLSSHDG